MIEEKPERVIFRAWKDSGDVIAIFPDWNYGNSQTSKPGMVMSFEHVGQHGEASWPGLKSETRAATPAEYAAVKEELESSPYDYRLEVVTE
jgi:acyl-CoA-binding protein